MTLVIPPRSLVLSMRFSLLKMGAVLRRTLVIVKVTTGIKVVTGPTTMVTVVMMTTVTRTFFTVTGTSHMDAITSNIRSKTLILGLERLSRWY